MTEEITRDLFHCVSLIAFAEVWRETGQFPPDSEAVRQKAYALYEAELRVKNAGGRE
ncbi:hypothetical protein J8F10_09155 [Gemmata sp. G18]|uniref:Uncharacterized protein n=1 Tax=Gemmata palustris TaxID=2822762 RepID=A0ABS5BP29_9BACT|nr:hypothetical protein [Gemmata palustris]MBP3955448.1 hypothetical protein [Gemmata palustris]